ncbi:hypothetical protein SAMN02910291_02312 [Desulfovibrio desulfuricans]|uniref:Uncharacterized protein n=1 Tax=Desulfovibrio desulfuricans TaxID=876 RepID=A0AA94HUE2_DESDE|nr:hypothetical protein CNY67_11840 [Desulfovibrio sp. G11]SFW65305.1 hypothetical protein SAMN02910291_02312 [Desulfovibrio desulfuricans]SPD34743.1 Hypothetical protein DSVG11_0626 [Desulfovibrio sp. G11]
MPRWLLPRFKLSSRRVNLSLGAARLSMCMLNLFQTSFRHATALRRCAFVADAFTRSRRAMAT